MNLPDSFHSDLRIAKEMVYDNCGLELTNPILSPEGKEYGACSFRLGTKLIEHRFSKITRTKAGQFVTIWKRNAKGRTEPFNISDKFDFIIVTARRNDLLGQFIFPKTVLANQRVISNNGIEGKRGIRIYPPWDMPLSNQAKKSQDWQTSYFYSINDSTDIERVRKLITG